MTDPGPGTGKAGSEARFAKIALFLFFAGEPAETHSETRPQLARWIQAAYAQLEPKRKQQLLQALRAAGTGPVPRPPPLLVDWLRDVLGQAGLKAWARAFYPRALDRLGEEGWQKLLINWLAGQPGGLRVRVLEAGIRAGVGRASEAEIELIDKSLGQQLCSKEEKMPELKFVFDANRLPRAFDQARFEQAVIDELDKNLSTPNVPANRVVQAAIIGMLLLDEHFDPSAPGFVDDVRRAWIEFLQRRKDVQGRFIYNREVYAKIAEIALKIRTGNPDVTVFFQEFATVGRHVSEGVAQIPPDHPNFETQVRIGFDRYVAGRPPLDSLELPPLTGEDGTDVEIEPENIRAVGLIYAAHSLEEMRLFHVVDRITEVFMNGALPIGFDAGGRALDTYYWDREDRMNEAERRMQYSRVLGAPGGDVSREVQPNTTFDGLFLRFLSAIAEFDRQQRIDELFDANSNGGRSLNLTGEYVRKAGRDLAANASLYGWGGTHFAARRINNHIAVSLDLLKQPSIQKAYGVTNPYQVIERVATTEFGVTPNIVRYRTMAEAGNKILDIVAKNHKVWARTGGRPLFSERIGGENFNGDISPEDQAELVRQTQFWLAVNGIKDDQVDKLSQPEISTYVPSVPTFGNMLPGTMPARNGHGATNGSGAMDKLKAMVAAGQAPTLDQLQQLVKFGS